MRLSAFVVPDCALERLVRACDLPFTLAAPETDVTDGALYASNRAAAARSGWRWPTAPTSAGA